MTSPNKRYLKDIQQDDFFADASQESAVLALEKVYCGLILREQAECRFSFSRLLPKLFSKPASPVKGLYLWGGVGRGKTYLMDSFYESLPFDKKLRVHFHRFMRRVHLDLAELEGEINPLRRVAEGIANETLIICFDEFFVSDIADAMILANLLEELFALNVSFVTTSNIPPKSLYKDGLQRQKFLPAIALIERNCDIFHVDGDIDYRLRSLEKAPLYCTPLDQKARDDIEAIFYSLAPIEEEIRDRVDVEIEGRLIAVVKLSEDMVWFSFADICEGPRSQNDFIEISKEFHTVIISDIPQMGFHNDDAARRFISLVDEFYDHNVKLALSASAPLEDLYLEGRLAFEFERTKSRLLEMQSHDYLSRAHRP